MHVRMHASVLLQPLILTQPSQHLLQELQHVHLLGCKASSCAFQ